MASTTGTESEPPARGRIGDSCRRGAAAAAFAGLGAYSGCLAALLPTLKASLHATDATLGAALLAGAAGALPGGIVLGPLAARAGRQALSLCVGAAGLLIIGLAGASSMAQFVLALVVLGAAWSVVDVITNGVIVAHERRDRRPLLQAAHAYYPVAAMLASLGTGIALQVGASVASILHVVVIINIAIALGNIGALSPQVQPVAGARRSHIPRPVLIIGLIGCLAFLFESALFSWSAIDVAQVYASNAFVAALAPTAFSLAMVISRVLAHRRSARLSNAALMKHGLGAAGAGVALAALAPHPIAAIAGFGLTGFGLGSWAPAMYGMAGQVAHDTGRNSTIGEVATMSYSGMIVGPGLVGGIAGLAGLRLAVACLAVPVVILAFILHRWVGQPASEGEPPASPV